MGLAMRRPAAYLYVPGDSPRKLARSAVSDVGAVLADLEDSVASVRKDDARAAVASWARDPTSARQEKWVRINAGDRAAADIEAVWSPTLHGVCVPKVSGPGDVEVVVDVLDRIERGSGITTAIMPLVESAAGLNVATSIALAPRVTIMQLGEMDLAADLTLEPDDAGAELLMARSQLVLASRLAGLPAPIGGVYANLADESGLRATTRQLRRLGFGARAVIHPGQVAVVRGVFEPSDGEVVRARQQIATYQRAVHEGVGVYRDDSGRMIDIAAIRRAEDLIAKLGESVE